MMKNALLSSFLVLSILFIFTKCKKDNAAPATATVNYSPLTTGSSWTYNYTENGSTESYTYTATDKDTTINSKKYRVLSSSDGSSNKYMSKIDSNYYRYASIAEIGNFEELYLKDNREVNSTWPGTATIDYPGLPAITANLTYTVKEKGISYAVNGKTYNEVIHVRLDAEALFNNIGGGDFYYANNVGLIESKITLSYLTQTFTSNQQLTASSIK